MDYNNLYYFDYYFDDIDVVNLMNQQSRRNAALIC